MSVAVAGEARRGRARRGAGGRGQTGGAARDLVAAIDDGEVDEETETLERILELGLQTGRIRALYGPGGEQAALRLFRRLPLGPRPPRPWRR